MRQFDFFYGLRSRARHALLVAVLCAAGFANAAAGQVHVAAGTGWGLGGTGLVAEVGGRYALGDDGRISLGAAALGGDAGAGFGAAEARAEFRIDPAALFAPFVTLRAGVVAADDHTRSTWGLSLGLAPRIGPGRRLRISGAWSRTEGAGGPHRLLIGLEFGGR